ncbi:NADH-quinone oxidoreductase subunit L [Longimicrobium terrae]|uniref:NADH-quinone oxidoreductase subunit L n=1 Tax=Longimicrobium terrae TaxID=1639882 RepID=A0A841H049_9BACT|nr:NADH-quinone oxidoreductase subunit L [Longimicrobium terrae]MBB4637046.1 NADH-quinone oxidoreductase subunit L [Longimicrobium terrae]MBB6071346.1 NADH-quinone oxidoreductase subunit L [Longimicrobium terrae]NNC31435.1 NADH-quinone oxidoreductase subunit L [Longimicrobium terrae]
MLLLQHAAEAATEAGAAVQHGAAAADAHGAAFHPVLPWLILGLPLLGFLINGLVAIIAARRALPKVPPVGDPYWDSHGHDDHAHAASPALAMAGHGHDALEPSEQEGMDPGVRPNPADHAHDHAHGHDAHGHDAHDDHGHAAGPKPWTHVLPSFVAPGVMIAAFAVAVLNFLAMRGAHEFEAIHGWDWFNVGDLQVGFDLLLDPLSMVMALIITGVGSLIHIFSIGYMKEDPGYPRYMAYLNLFVFFMLILVLGSSYPLMFVGWEGVGLCSYLLIGFWFREKANADAGKKAFIVNRVGDFGFLIAMFLLFANLGTLNFAEVMAAAPTGLEYAGPVVTAIALFFFLGATGKSAQIPLYIWLPDAMAGPTPVSALIHAATMVTAGVYLVVRSSVIFTMAPTASLLVALVGALTAFFAATIGLKQWDIKKVLAYSTVSQLGFMFAAVGMGAYVAGVFHLMTHAFFKACLFLGSGAVIHAMHGAFHATHNAADAQDMRNMGGLKKFLPVTFITMGLSTLAIAGFPGLSGFFSKDEIIGAAWLGAQGSSPFSGGSLFGIPGTAIMGFVGGTLTLAAFMTAFYMGRMMIYTFFGNFRGTDVERGHLHEGNWTLTVPLIVLALLATVGGYLNVEKAVFDHVPVLGPIFNALAIGGDASLHHWLHPVIAGSEDVIRNHADVAEPAHAAWPIFLAIVIGIGGLALAWVLTKKRNERVRTADVEPAYQGGLEKALYNKWYVDEFYDRVVVRPVGFLSRVEWGIDRVLDGMVDGVGRMAERVGLALGRVQTGHVNTYAFVLILGVLVLLGSFMAL